MRVINLDDVVEALKTGFIDPDNSMVENPAECNSMLEWAIEKVENMPSAQPEITRCHQCGFWDRDTLQHNFNDFRDWNEAECLVLAERDGYHEINRYTEADDFCSRAERRTDGLQ